jgi:hypothetical protein
VHAHLRRGDAALVIAGVAAEENARLIVVGRGGARQARPPGHRGGADLVASARPAMC